jgi:hypothetical protein
MSNSENQGARVRLLIDSVRSFGGPFRQCPIWHFDSCAQQESREQPNVRVIPLAVPEPVRHNWFAPKVWACAQAEALAGPAVRSLIWMSHDSLVVRPPLLLDLRLEPESNVAVRPVHIKNIGLEVDGPVDDFWKAVYAAVGVQDIQTVVESFVDGSRIRAYYNSHTLSVNPALGLFCRWYEVFESLVADRAFQSGPCRDDLHQVFLHQAVSSALIATSLDAARIRLLPVEYSYPYNLHEQVPKERRARSLNDLVCFAYEDRPLDPDVVSDIQIDEPLRSWLAARIKRTRRG